MGQIQGRASVGGKELIATLTLFVCSNLFLNYPQYIAKSGYEASWMEPLVSGILTLVLFLIVDMVITRFFPGLDIVEICKERFGRFFACIVALVFAIYFLGLTASVMRQFTENVAMTVLPTTPILVIGTMFVLVVGYVAYNGLEGIARISYIFLPVLIVAVLLMCLLTINWWRPAYLLPFWGTGMTSVVYGSMKYSSIFNNVLLLCIIYPHAHNPRALRWVGVTSIVISTVLLTGFMLTYNMIFPPAETGKIAFPMYQLARMIYIGRFIQRLESVFIFMWVGAAAVKMAITLWGAAYILGSAFRWPTFRPAIPALALLTFIASLIPRNAVQMLTFDETYVVGYGWIIVFGLPLAIVLLAVMFRGLRRGGLDGV